MPKRLIKYSFSDSEIDTLMFLLDESIMELRNKKLKGMLDEIDAELLQSEKDCRKVLMAIEGKRNSCKGARKI
jgi:phosphoribosylamine-glycine ligase